MSGVYSMTGGPTYTGASSGEWMQDALDTPLSLFSTLGQSAKSGVLDSFGLGTFIKDKMLPEEAPTVAGTPRIVPDGEGGFTYKRETPEEMAQRRADMGAMSEDQYKASAFYRQDIPWDAGMTEARAAALAQFDDARKARDYFAQKRPFAAFIGGLGGQAIDPINYIPVFGEAVQGAQVARFGYVGGRLLMGAADAAINTGVASVATAGDRAKFGDDVSWQATISQMATAALLGGAFGALHGAFEGRGARLGAMARADAESRLSDLKTTQEARIALNEGIDAIVRGEDVNLSPNATEPLQRIADDLATRGPPPQEVANSIVGPPSEAGFSLDPNATFFHGGKADLAEFTDAFRRDGTPKDKYDVRGIYVTENRRLAEQYVGKDGKVHEVQIDAKNPIVLPDPRFPEIDSASLTAKDIEKLKAAGYDSVVNKQRMEVALFEGRQVRHKALVAKQPSYDLVRADHGDMGLPEPKAGVDDRVYAIHRDGQPVAYANVEFRGDQAYVKDIFNVDTLDTSHSLGTSAMAQLLRQLVKENPGLKTLAGERVSGARRGGVHGLAGTGEDVVIPLPGTRRAIDTAKAAPEPPPQGLKQAEASVAKLEDAKALAAQYGVDPNTGAFKEDADITQLADEGRLTEQDVATMAQAHMDYEVADAYAEAIKSVSGCLI
ncbi:hypothetical protein EOA64_00440 [Mesorhizobium sp. M1A.F.Ca.IN.022.02.1.1]|uniref:ADP-ribosyltransferase-containing protein n=1 Tax=Mesorhizobium sp. M1A.F.Ca.IN.022.02.1.1 TaxID=2496766 RepID=UPI000FCC1FDF|nr:hypothetical protein [Mesorhizobium sp. M1A.F.Ca.IN.022.02.1.1]RUV65846.1 hypothetical protein EOA64_00440 [Mesorhizobium sp. M1A.F.Ca.IN.022.02.1.1]RWI33401.1 MAG: hypothetical protein EOR13_17760 [Mesorhizobium sp.]